MGQFGINLNPSGSFPTELKLTQYEMIDSVPSKFPMLLISKILSTA
jgi:hypothetical protein